MKAPKPKTQKTLKLEPSIATKLETAAFIRRTTQAKIVEEALRHYLGEEK